MLTGRVYPANCLVIAGEHRGLGAGVSKVRSLKMDRKVWTETLIQVGLSCLSPLLGVSPRSCHFPPSEPGGLRWGFWKNLFLAKLANWLLYEDCFYSFKGL